MQSLIDSAIKRASVCGGRLQLKETVLRDTALYFFNWILNFGGNGKEGDKQGRMIDHHPVCENIFSTVSA